MLVNDEGKEVSGIPEISKSEYKKTMEIRIGITILLILIVEDFI